MMEDTIEGIDPRISLQAAVAASGGQSAFARKYGISKSHVCNLLAGRKRFSDDLLAFLGYQRVIAAVVKDDYDAWLEPASREEGDES